MADFENFTPLQKMYSQHPALPVSLEFILLKSNCISTVGGQNGFCRWCAVFLFFFPNPFLFKRAVPLIKYNCTLPLILSHSSHPTLCTRCGWSYRPCHTTHVITLFSSHLYSPAWRHTHPHPPLSPCTQHASKCGAFVYVAMLTLWI